MPNNRVSSLINGSLGRPKIAIAGKRCNCSKCDAAIHKDEKCYDIPNPHAPFSAKRRFCISCFREILDKTETDLTGIRNEVNSV